MIAASSQVGKGSKRAAGTLKLMRVSYRRYNERMMRKMEKINRGRVIWMEPCCLR